MARDMKQYLEWCDNCQKKTLHYREGKKINWMMHIALMFVAGLGFITLAFAIVGRLMSAQANPKKTCSSCGFEH